MNWRDIKWQLTFVAVVVLLLPPGLWLYADISSGRRLAAKLAALKAQGMPLTLAEAAPEPVPDEENAAVLYQQVFQVQFGPGASYPSGRDIGDLTSDEQDLLCNYRMSSDEQVTAQVREILNRPAVRRDLEILRRASQRPHCVFPVNWQDSAAAVFPHYSRFRVATEIVAVRMVLCAEEGDIHEALAWCKVCLRMSRHIASEPTLMAQLVSYAMHSITFAGRRPLLSEAIISPSAATSLDNCLGQIDLYRNFADAMIGERAMYFELVQAIYRDPSRVSEFYDGKGLLGWPLDTLYFSRPFGPLHRADQLNCLEHCGKQIELARLPYRDVKSGLEQSEADLAKLNDFRGLLTKMFSSVFARTWQKRDQTVANTGLCRVVLALKGYKYQRGKYPATLEELQQSLDWNLPEDPFSGENFVYQPQGKGFKLYSIGPNMFDDAGLPEYTPQGKWRGDDADIVWECVR